MKQLPPKVLEEIYFKSIIPAVIYGIVVWGNCSSAMPNSLNHIHERESPVTSDLAIPVRRSNQRQWLHSSIG